MNTATTANIQNNNPTAFYHLPGLFEFYELYRIFLPLFRKHREYFYDWCEIGSIYGAPSDCIWGAGVLHLDILIRKTCLIWCGNTASRPG